jgi:hypothetical protein
MQTVRVYCSVLYPDGSTDEDVERITSQAGAIFAEIVRRMDVEKR